MPLKEGMNIPVDITTVSEKRKNCKKRIYLNPFDFVSKK